MERIVHDPVVRRRAIGCGFVAAVVAAPFLALLYGPTAALVVMTLALTATASLIADAARAAGPPLRRRLLALAALNALLALGCAITAVVRLN